ncbi:fungal-specific transcription factor domain-containing protein [Dactylonectria macrodidyma]|uniref:Fungal-specific transcription factor domain-containing protein n=1 Tax=Dactylonectria macrodidyma TaxID=307937 RepID=A0A9P9JCW9_9HYPO|nr:fungal-specific transcription factor domain-containing protein [Dactylonectria macrodidyma]
MESPPSSSRPRRITRASKRAAVACKACNQRKVRCTVTLSGRPCANCTVDGVPCEILGRKRRHNSYLLPGVSDSPGEDQDESRLSTQTPQQTPQQTPPVQVTPSTPSVTHTSQADVSSTVAAQEKIEVAQYEASGNDECSNHQDDTQTPRPFAMEHTPALENPPFANTAASPSPRAQTEPSEASRQSKFTAYPEILETISSPEDRVPFYPGDKRGPAILIDICDPNRSLKSNLFFVPMPSIESLLPEDVSYLRSKGAFSLPARHIQEALIRCYFHHVHPFSPILEPDDFISKYEKGHVSLLLLWSMFLAAASFIDESYFSDDFYPTRSDMKRAVYRGAKALYDVDYEQDKITLIQSVFLLSHWYNNSEDRTGPWHWTGIAISLSHTIGLHRQPVITPETSEVVRPCWRRLWWSIYIREVWLSLGQGRPIRISLKDCDTPMVGPYDEDRLPSARNSEKYLPSNLTKLFALWVSLARLSRVLGTILSTNYAAHSTKPSRAEIESDEREIRECNCIVAERTKPDPVLSSHIYQFKLYLEASIIVLYRPFVLEPPLDVSSSEQASWKTLACQKTRAAASEATGAVNSMLAEDLLKLCLTITVLAMGPPMQIHLFESTSSKHLLRQTGKHNLALCMLAMNELRKSYVSADAAYELFDRAIGKVDAARARKEQSSASSDFSNDDSMQTDHIWGSYPEGYDILVGGIVSDVWMPFLNNGTDYGPWI